MEECWKCLRSAVRGAEAGGRADRRGREGEREGHCQRRGRARESEEAREAYIIHVCDI